MVIKYFGPRGGIISISEDFALIKMPDGSPAQKVVDVRVLHPTHEEPDAIPTLDTKSHATIQSPRLTASGKRFFEDEEDMSREIARIEAVAMAGIIGVIYRTGVEDTTVIQPEIVSAESVHCYGYISSLQITRSSNSPFGTKVTSNVTPEKGLVWSFQMNIEFTVTEYDPYGTAPGIADLI